VTEPKKAVFLSYASQDAEAARRICEVLRAGGIEVWLDQSELRGGDAWDASIKRQISSCALFMPIISKNTQARAEGYFRLEWKLAVDRSHLMANDKAFLVPVVIDGVSEPEARVPEKFREVQWMSLQSGESQPAFTERIVQLLAPARDAPPLAATEVETGTRARPGKPAIAVLPFVNLSGDPDQDYFADGMVEEIVTALSRFEQLFVIARSSSFIYKGRNVDVRQVAKELRVRYVLEGSVRKSGKRVRIACRLIDAAAGTHLWADKFDGTLEDIFDLQDKITANVVGAIEPTVKKAEIERARRKPADNLDAYDLYLRALPLVYAFRPAENLEGLRLLQRSIAIDPHYPAALAYAAWCYEQRIMRGWPRVGSDDVEAAISLARRVLDTGTDDAVALVLAGFVLEAVGRDWDVAVEASRRALRSNAGSGFVSLMASLCMTFAGKPEEGLALAERAMELSPLDPAFFMYLLAGAFAQLFRGRSEEALALAQQSVTRYSEWDTTYWVLVTAYVQLDRLPEARTALSKLLALTPEVTIARLGTQSYRDPASIRMILEAMRKVGLPE